MPNRTKCILLVPVMSKMRKGGVETDVRKDVVLALLEDKLIEPRLLDMKGALQ
jgi:hypothetical protein